MGWKLPPWGRTQPLIPNKSSCSPGVRKTVCGKTCWQQQENEHKTLSESEQEIPKAEIWTFGFLVHNVSAA